MASKGETKTQKRISASRVMRVARKGKMRFVHRVKAGPHSKSSSVPLAFAIRDLLGCAANAREAKKMLNSDSVKVNGIVRQNLHFGVGLFDIVEIVQDKKRFRAVFNSHGQIRLVEIPMKGELAKLCSITKKQTIKGGRMQLTTNDGSTFSEAKTGLKVGDSVKFGLPDRKALARYPFKKGSYAYVTGGKHVGTVAKIADIIEGTISRPRLVSLESNGEKFITVGRNVFVVGEKNVETETGTGDSA